MSTSPSSPQAAQRALDTKMMRAALSLASSIQGSTFPNPPVGCIIAHADSIIAFATTAPSGRPHAETQALSIAAASAQGATLYTTLEPCTHKNTHNTPPCCEAIAKSKISRICYPNTRPRPPHQWQMPKNTRKSQHPNHKKYLHPRSNTTTPTLSETMHRENSALYPETRHKPRRKNRRIPQIIPKKTNPHQRRKSSTLPK